MADLRQLLSQQIKARRPKPKPNQQRDAKSKKKDFFN